MFLVTAVTAIISGCVMVIVVSIEQPKPSCTVKRYMPAIKFSTLKLFGDGVGKFPPLHEYVNAGVPPCTSSSMIPVLSPVTNTFCFSTN